MISIGCQACRDFVTLYRDKFCGGVHPVLQQNFSVLPKMHILEIHVPEFAMRWGTVAFFGVDVIETVHKEYNEMGRRLAGVRNVHDNMACSEDIRNLKFEQGARCLSTHSKA